EDGDRAQGFVARTAGWWGLVSCRLRRAPARDGLCHLGTIRHDHSHQRLAVVSSVRPRGRRPAADRTWPAIRRRLAIALIDLERIGWSGYPTGRLEHGMRETKSIGGSARTVGGHVRKQTFAPSCGARASVGT